MDLLRTYEITAPNPLALARAFGIPISKVGLRLGVTTDYVRRLAGDIRHSHRVRRAVLELALEQERLEQAIR